MNSEYKQRSYDGNETIIGVGLLFECCNNFREMWVHFHDAVKIFGIDFINPWTNLVRRYVYEIVPRTQGSSLGNAAYMAEFMSKKGLIERRIHLATCRKASTASDNLVMIRPWTWWATTTYLSLSASCVSMDKGDHFSAGSRRHGGG